MKHWYITLKIDLISFYNLYFKHFNTQCIFNENEIIYDWVVW